LKIDDGSNRGKDISTNHIAIEIMKNFVSKFNGKSGWKLYYKQNVKIEMNKKFAMELEEFAKNNIEAIKTRKRSPEILDKKAKAKEDLTKLLIKFKKNILEQTENTKSFLGGNEIEGVIIRNIKTGSIVKVVDVDKFSNLNMKNWEFRTELKNERKELYKLLIDSVVKSADIFVLKSKQEEKIISYLESQGKHKLDSLEEIIDVMYEDASNEVQLDDSNEVTVKMRKIVEDYIKKIEEIKKTTISSGLDDKNYKLTIDNLNTEIIEMKNLLVRIIKLNEENKNPYTEIIKFILGSKGSQELKDKFVVKV
jgi:hypothetical protein